MLSIPSPRDGKSPHKPVSQSRALLKKRKSRSSLLFHKAESPAKKRPHDHISTATKDNNDLANFGLGPSKKLRYTCSPQKVKSAGLPTDMRLGTKLSITSDRPFPFSPESCSEVTLRLNEVEARKWIRQNPRIEDRACHSNPEIVLQSAAIYYNFPNMKFLRGFPRLEGFSGLSRTDRFIQQPLTREILDSIADQWSEAFDYLYNAWRNDELTSFYVCAAKFTVLFVKDIEHDIATTDGLDPGDTSCMGFSEYTRYRAIVTPSSREIKYEPVFSGRRRSRDDLNDSCISFADTNESFVEASLERSFSMQTRCTREATPEKDVFLTRKQPEEEYVSPLKLGEEVENDDFLRQIGLSPSVMRVRKSQADSLSQSFTEDSQDSLSGKLSSSAGTTLVVSEVVNVDALRSLLCNNRLGWAKSGPDAGLPPTLLSTEEFRHAGCSVLDIKSQKLKRGNDHKYVLELQGGPILPHVPKMMIDFLRKCGNQMTDHNSVNFNIAGRLAYDGFNEAVASDLRNINSYTFNASLNLFEF